MQQNRINYILFIIILLVFNSSLFSQVKNKKFDFKLPFFTANITILRI